MTTKGREVLEAALALSEDDRTLIAERLLASIGDGLQHLNEDEFEAELNRRADECSRDPGARIPWNELKNEPT